MQRARRLLFLRVPFPTSFCRPHTGMQRSRGLSLMV
jgi:hypothetical protein